MSAAVESVVAYVDQFGDAREHWELAFGNGMAPSELALLATRLRGVDPPTRVDSRGYHVQVEPRFELRPRERRELAARLIAAGHADDVAARNQTGVSRTTWWRIRRDVEDANNGGLTPLSEPRSDAGLRVSKRENPGCSQSPVSAGTTPLLVAPRRKRPKGMPSALCGVCSRDRFAYATARASEVNEDGPGTTAKQFVQKWKAAA
jgi:hypothetical protein